MGTAPHVTSPLQTHKTCCTWAPTSGCRVILEAAGPPRDPTGVTAQPMTNAAADLHLLLYMGPRCRPTGVLLYMGSHLEVQGHLGAAAQGLPIIMGDGEGAACLGFPDVLLVVIVLGDDLQSSRNRALVMWCRGLSWLHTMHARQQCCSAPWWVQLSASPSEGWT